MKNKLKILSIRIERKAGDAFAGEKFRLVNRESGAKDQTPKHGVIAKAEIQNSVTGKVQTIHGGGQWEIDPVKLSIAGQLEQLKTELLALGLGERAIDYAIKNAKTI